MICYNFNSYREKVDQRDIQRFAPAHRARFPFAVDHGIHILRQTHRSWSSRRPCIPLYVVSAVLLLDYYYNYYFRYIYISFPTSSHFFFSQRKISFLLNKECLENERRLNVLYKCADLLIGACMSVKGDRIGYCSQSSAYSWVCFPFSFYELNKPIDREL